MGIFSGKKKSTVFKSNAGDEILVAPENFNDESGNTLINAEEEFKLHVSKNNEYSAEVSRLYTQEEIDELKASAEKSGEKQAEDQKDEKSSKKKSKKSKNPEKDTQVPLNDPASFVEGFNSVKIPVTEDFVQKARKKLAPNEAFNAIRSGNKEYFQNLAKDKNRNVDMNAKSVTGDTIMHMAVTTAVDVELVKLLLDVFKADIDSKNDRSYTPLMELVSKRKIEEEDEIMLDYLIERKADLDSQTRGGLKAVDLVADERLKLKIEMAMGIDKSHGNEDLMSIMLGANEESDELSE